MLIACVDSLYLVTCAVWLELWLVWARDPRDSVLGLSLVGCLALKWAWARVSQGSPCRGLPVRTAELK